MAVGNVLAIALQNAELKQLSPWPMPRPPKWVSRVNKVLPEKELEAAQGCAQLGAGCGVEWIARRLNTESTIRPRDRPHMRPPEVKTKRRSPFLPVNPPGMRRAKLQFWVEQL